MANGTMRGTGTEADPLLCEDVFDFCNINAYNGTASTHTHIKQIGTVDFNDHPTYKMGLDKVELITAPYVEFDGNAKDIRNLVYKNTSFGSDKPHLIQLDRVINANFLNMISMNVGVANANSWVIKSAETKHCTFNILATTPRDMAHLIPQNCGECVLNISGAFGNFTYNDQSKTKKITKSHINFDMAQNSQVIFPMLLLDNCYITGKVKNTLNTNYTLVTGSIFNSYFAFELNATGVLYITYNGSLTRTGINFVDTEKLGKPLNGNDSNVYKLTTAQCKDAAYLRSIGFPVIEVTE